MIPYIRGRVSRQAHVNVPEGLFEEEYARNGFFGRYAHLYRTEPPVGWTDIDGPLRPQSFDLTRIEIGSDFLQARKTYLGNDDCKIQFCKLNQSMDYFFRNADGDEVFFVHVGSGRLETDFGPLNYSSGDYLVIPRGTVYRILVNEPSAFLIVESFSEIDLPDKGMLGQHALFDPAVIQVPTPEPQSANVSQKKFVLKIQRSGKITNVTYPFNPINAVGWKGTLTVWQINVKDIRPISSDRYHLPPTAHCTFVAHNFVICTFLPRPLEVGDPTAMKVPFYHSNIDFDEVLFYHAGEFFSRTGVKSGMLTFHPQGIHHGPQPGAVKRTAGSTHTNEVAVMIDTKRPLQVFADAIGIENKEYWASWKEPRK